jgi:hypothetical protein
MRREYDFSRAEKGKFFRKGARLNIPVYLDRRTLPFVQRVAKRRGTDLSTAVNEILRGNIRLTQLME